MKINKQISYENTDFDVFKEEANYSTSKFAVRFVISLINVSANRAAASSIA